MYNKRTFAIFENEIKKLKLCEGWEHLVIVSLFGNQVTGITSIIKLYLSFYKHAFFSIGTNILNPDINYLFTYSNSLAYNRDLVFNPIRYMPNQNSCAVIKLKENLFVPYDIDINASYFCGKIKSISLANFFFVLRKIFVLNKIVLFKKTTFNIREKLIIIGHFQIIYLNYFKFYYFLKKTKIKAIITDYDRHHIWATLILAAKSNDIKSFTHLHGLIYKGSEYAYTPLIADIVFCWGNLHKETLMRFGESESKLIITGSPRFSVEKVNEDLEGLYYTLILNPSVNKIESFVYELLEIAKEKNKRVAIKLHPSQHINDFIIYADWGIKIWSYSDSSIKEIVELTDIFFVTSSGFAFDLCFYNKPIIVLSFLADIGSSQILIDFGAALQVNNIIYLRSSVKLLDDRSVLEKLIIKMNQFSKEYIQFQSFDASLNIKRLIIS